MPATDIPGWSPIQIAILRGILICKWALMAAELKHREHTQEEVEEMQRLRAAADALGEAR